VLYPPVDTDTFSFRAEKEDFYLAASRLVPYKRMDLIVEAFADMPDKKLVVIGDGPEAHKIKDLNLPNVTWLGYQSGEVLRDYMQRARAFIFAAMEDFGIIPLEAQACGTPVIAFGQGGIRETVRGPERPNPTGVFFYEQTVDALKVAIETFECSQADFRPEACRKNAERFSNERFRHEVREIVESAWEEFRTKNRP
jgi:glycosyltransferase involved in cell wall biosynthesis